MALGSARTAVSKADQSTLLLPATSEVTNSEIFFEFELQQAKGFQQ